MPQHYTKIEINGDQRNLPEDGSNIFIHFVESNRGAYIEEFKRPDHKENLDLFLKEVDYYLLPVPEPQQPENKHQIELKVLGIIKEKLGITVYSKEAVHAAQEIAELIASLSHNNTVVGPSETEIDAQARIFEQNDIVLDISLGRTLTVVSFSEGAKYALSQCKAVDLRATLIKFMKEYKKRNAYMLILDEHIENEVDDYLKSPENK